MGKIVVKHGDEVLQYVNREGFGSAILHTEHYIAHGRDFGAESELEYELLAKQFMNRPIMGTVIAKTRMLTSEQVRFDTVTQEFGAMAPDGRIKTFYRPNPTIHKYPTNMDYFNAQ